MLPMANKRGFQSQIDAQILVLLVNYFLGNNIVSQIKILQLSETVYTHLYNVTYCILIIWLVSSAKNIDEEIFNFSL